MNITNYVKTYGNKSFKECPFRDVDSLIFSTLVYVHLDLLIPEYKTEEKHKKYKIKDLLNLDKHPDLTDYDLAHQTVMIQKSLMKFLPEIRKSKRFGNVKVGYLEKYFDPVNESQFFAVTFFLDDDSMFIAFRGTDDSLIGWKEDLNMAILTVVPGQIKSAIYANAILKLEPDKKFYIGGHSKGGNLAYYAANYIDEKHLNNLIKVYNLDGPGFKAPEVIFRFDRKTLIDSKSFKTMPHASIVGSLLNHDAETKIIKSKQLSLLQHDMFSWVIDPKTVELVFLNKRSLISKVNEEAIRKLINQISDEDKKIIADAILELLGGSSISLFDILRYPLITLKYWRKKYKEFPKEKRHLLYVFVSTLGKFWYQAMFATIKRK